ncbi:hypothetical protein CR513_45817, partial [Mucuna pruriens]
MHKCVEKFIIKITNEQLADIFTKAWEKSLFEKFKERPGLIRREHALKRDLTIRISQVVPRNVTWTFGTRISQFRQLFGLLIGRIPSMVLQDFKDLRKHKFPSSEKVNNT